jgi:hypothetical protein
MMPRRISRIPMMVAGFMYAFPNALLGSGDLRCDAAIPDRDVPPE